MTRAQLWTAFKPWAGLVAALVAGGFSHQFGAQGTFDNCQRFSPWPLLLVAVLCALLAAAGGWSSASVAREVGRGNARRIVAIISIGMAALALFAILLPMIASLTLPPCFQ